MFLQISKRKFSVWKHSSILKRNSEKQYLRNNYNLLLCAEIVLRHSGVKCLEQTVSLSKFNASFLVDLTTCRILDRHSGCFWAFGKWKKLKPLCLVRLAEQPTIQQLSPPIFSIQFRFII